MWNDDNWSKIVQQLGPKASPIVRAIVAGADPDAMTRLLGLGKDDNPVKILKEQNDAKFKDELDDMIGRVNDYENDGMSRDDAFDRVREERLQEEADQAARKRRERIMNMRKDLARVRFYDTIEQSLKKLSPKLALRAAR